MKLVPISIAEAKRFVLYHHRHHRPPQGALFALGAEKDGHHVLWLAPTTTPWRAYEQPPGSQASREVRTPHSPQSVARMAGLYTGAGTHRKQSRKHELHPDGARPTTVFTCPVGGEPNPDQHPARMPLKLAQHLVAMCCPPEGLVLDPFSGNATTGVAANRIGRRYLGIEIDLDYAESSRRRLADDSPLFAAAADDDLQQFSFA